MSFLVNCRLCGGIVSSTANKCPHCGEISFLPLMPSVTFKIKTTGIPSFVNLYHDRLCYGVMYSINLANASFVTNGHEHSTITGRMISTDHESFTKGLQLSSNQAIGRVKIDFIESMHYYEGDGDFKVEDKIIDTKQAEFSFCDGSIVNLIIGIGINERRYEANKCVWILGHPVHTPFKEQYTSTSYYIESFRVR